MSYFNLLLRLLLSACTITCAQAQVMDSTFGEPKTYGGDYAITSCDFGGRTDRLFGVFVLDQNDILLMGHTCGGDGCDLGLVRLTPNGKFDNRYGNEGRIRVDLGYPNDSCLAGALSADRQMLFVAGCTALPDGRRVNLLARTDVEGRLDPRFGQGGTLLLDLPSSHELVTRLLLQPDGKLLVGGNAIYGDFNYPDSTAVFVGRLFPDGRVDSSFAQNGFLFRRFGTDCNCSVLGDLALDPNGKLFVTGSSLHPFHYYPGSFNPSDHCQHRLKVFRFLPNGKIDLGFDRNGLHEFPFTKGLAFSLLANPDGTVLVGGAISDGLGGPYYTFLAKLMPDGRPDVEFANDGQFIKALRVLDDYVMPFKLVKMGNKTIALMVDFGERAFYGLASFDENGFLTQSFGKNGTYFMPYQLGDALNSLQPIDANNLLVGGYHSPLIPDNMVVLKVKLGGSSVSTGTASPAPVVLYPNPAGEGYFNVSLPEETGLGSFLLRVYGPDGRLVLERRLADGEQTPRVDASAWPSGVYGVALLGAEGQQYSGRVVVDNY